MPRLVSLVNWALPLFYLALLIDYGVAFLLRPRPSETRGRARPGEGAGGESPAARNRLVAAGGLTGRLRQSALIPVVVIHAVFLVLLSVVLGRPAVVTNPEILSVVAISTAAVYAAVEGASRDRRTGAFVLLLVFLFQYTSSFFLALPGLAPGRPLPGSAAMAAPPRWERLHVVLAILAYTAFSISAVYGLLHLVVRRNLKQHRFGPLFDRLPPLDLLARMSWRAVLVGFVLITLTILTAAGLAATGRFTPAGAATFWNPKVTIKLVVGLAAWLIYTVAVVGKFVGKWPASRVSFIAVNGFVAIAVLFVVSAVLS